MKYPHAYAVILLNSSNCELDRKVGDDIGDLLRAYADEGCLSGGDTIRIIGDEDED